MGLFRSESFSLSCVCLMVLHLRPPAFPWDCRQMLHNVFLAHLSAKSLSLSQSKPTCLHFTKKCQGVSSMFVNENSCAFFQLYKDSCWQRISMKQNFKIHTHLVTSGTPLKPVCGSGCPVHRCL